MKNALRILFSPILTLFEKQDVVFEYRSSHRVVLIVMSVLFLSLSAGVLFVGWDQDPTYLLPVIVFGGAGLLGMIVGCLGNDQAVARIWGSRR